MQTIKKILLMSALSISVAACGALPKSGPGGGKVASNAVASYSDPEREAVPFDYVLVDLDQEVLSHFTVGRGGSIASTFGGSNTPPTVTIGPGDVIQLTIFESSEGGLFIPTTAGTRPGNFVQLPAQRIERSGVINVPYVDGLVQVSGRSPQAIAADIESRLENRALEPQVVVSVLSTEADQASVVGDVNNSGRFSVSNSGERILDLVSRAGGISTPRQETRVTLKRRGRSASMFYEELVKSERDNIFVLPKDIITIDRQRRTFVAVGASGQNGRFDFLDNDIKVSDAIGLAGGLLDERANPSRVFLHRKVHAHRLNFANFDLSRFDSEFIPVIFQFDLRKPGGYFLTQNFRMQNGDVIFVANSLTTEINKVLTILNNVGSIGDPIIDAINLVDD
ncbi:MAG: polysaccharide biosynthesis/export family protein [Pseudomonadota bacterium]